jgi:hypothetical protein
MKIDIESLTCVSVQTILWHAAEHIFAETLAAGFWSDAERDARLDAVDILDRLRESVPGWVRV